MSIWFLLFLVTVGNLAIGFGLGVHLGFGPDLSRFAGQLRELAIPQPKKKKKRAAAAPGKAAS